MRVPSIQWQLVRITGKNKNLYVPSPVPCATHDTHQTGTDTPEPPKYNKAVSYCQDLQHATSINDPIPSFPCPSASYLIRCIILLAHYKPVSERLFRVLSTFFFLHSLLHSAVSFGFATEGSSTNSRQPIRIPAKHCKYTRGSCVAAFRVAARFRPMEGSLFHGR